MKTKLFLIFFALLLAGCEPKPENGLENPQNQDTTLVPDTAFHGVTDIAPCANMLIVRFANAEQVKHVIVGHPIKDYNGDGYFEYYYDCGLSLNAVKDTISNMYVLSSRMVEFLLRNTTLADSSPFIPLVQDYYLVDWKWQQLCPLSSLTDFSLSNQLSNHIQHHVFVTDMAWNQLDDYLQIWNDNQNIQPIDLQDFKRVPFVAIDQFFGESKDMEKDPYFRYNYCLYENGLSVPNAYLYYQYGDSEASPNRTYLTYIAYCDSLQEVYKEHLIQLINHNQIDTVCLQ